MTNRADSLEIRFGTPKDAAHIAEIYNHYIAHTCITFEVDTVSNDDRREWIQQFTEDGPYQLLVAELEGQVVGFAASVRYHTRAAYYTSVMTSVYLNKDFKGQGIGKKLYISLLERLQNHPELHRAYALISLPNPASLILHDKLGFRKVGILEEAGKKFGKFLSVQILEKPL
jgi:phosphinothricin acetyltransferase